MSFREKLADLLKSIKDTLVHIFKFCTAMIRFAYHKCPTVPKPMRRYRMALCDMCEDKTSSGRCRICGCWLSLKTRCATESCPEGRWKVWTEADETRWKTGAQHECETTEY